MCHAGVRSHWYIWCREVWGQDAGEHSGEQVAGRASRGGPGSGYSGLLINQRPTNAGRHALTDLQPGRSLLLFSRGQHRSRIKVSKASVRQTLLCSYSISHEGERVALLQMAGSPAHYETASGITESM